VRAMGWAAESWGDVTGSVQRWGELTGAHVPPPSQVERRRAATEMWQLHDGRAITSGSQGVHKTFTRRSRRAHKWLQAQ
jgi:hypothetical protein